MTHTWRPSTSPCPVTTPSAGALSEPSRSVASRPSSTNVPASNRRSIRSRTVSLPFSCCLAMRSGPPMPRFLARRECSSLILPSYSSVTDQQILAHSPPVEKAVEVALRQPIALGRGGALPLAMLVADEPEPLDDARLAAVLAQSKAEVDVRDAVEAELGVEQPRGDRVGAPERHAVALDRVDLRTGRFAELLHAVPRAQPERSGDRDLRVGERVDQRGDRVAGQLDARVEQDAHRARRAFDPGVDRRGKADGRIEAHGAQAFGAAGLDP